MGYTIISNDVHRCQGQIGNHVCPYRVRCMRYVAYKSDNQNQQVSVADHLCDDLEFVFYIPYGGPLSETT